MANKTVELKHFASQAAMDLDPVFGTGPRRIRRQPKNNNLPAVAIGGGILVALLLAKTTSAGTEKISIKNPSLMVGDTLLYSFAGFEADSPVSIFIGTIQKETVISDEKGTGTGAFVVTSAGTFSLIASDLFSHITKAPFKVGAFVDINGWIPSLPVVVKATATPIVQSIGWQPTLSAVITSSITMVLQSQGWQAALYAPTIASVSIAAGQSLGWQATLYATVLAYANPTVIAPINIPQLTCAKTLTEGSILSFNFSGFDPNVDIYVWTVGLGGTWLKTDNTGAGSGSFYAPAPGNYTLEAASGTNLATCDFTVNATAPAENINLDVIALPGMTGSIIRSPDKNYYNEGDIVLLTAIPNLGAQFSYWEVGTESYSTNPLNIMIGKNDQTIFAHFLLI